MNTYLKFKKRGFKCLHYFSTFVCKTDIVNTNCYISNNTKHKIALDAIKITSEKDIASNNNISPSTVTRVIDSFSEHHKLYKHSLPEVLCFDEFKSVKAAEVL